MIISHDSSMDEQSPITKYSSISSSSSSSITTIEDDLTHELENMWKFKFTQTAPSSTLSSSFDIDSEDLLFQLLVSQALIEARDYKTLSFEEFETLRQHQVRLKTKLKATTQRLQIDKMIQETLQSLLTLSNDKNRESVTLLLDESQETDRKVKILTQRLEELESEEIETDYQVLQHTAGVLCLGLQKLEQLESSTTTTTSGAIYLHSPHHTAIHDMKAKLIDLQSELDTTIKPILKRILKAFDMSSIVQHSNSPIEWLDYLEFNFDSQVQEDVNQLIELKRTVPIMESEMARIQSLVALYQARENELKTEIEYYRDQVLKLRIEREQDPIPDHRKDDDDDDEQKLQEEQEEYQAQLKEQAALLDKLSRDCENWQREHDRLFTICHDLHTLVKDKERILDMRDVQIHELELVNNATPEVDSLRAAFLVKEAAWIEKSAVMEANYEGILKEFDRLTGTAMEFEREKVNYERRLDQLTQQVKEIEAQLIEEGKGRQWSKTDTLTTASLRKEFKKMIHVMKADHQRALEKEMEEKRHLERQLKNLKHEREMSRYERINKGIQTLSI
ncbi:Up-regulated during septation-domain-containing protein [Cokeromyces recurvatus]|uniref:Up-regulated during septation-domain-containing protein n=1 Tax=Cokeromyces recurvatus TaxID=90255 RepID=UPI002220E9C7|nr:Up-regulated during septation-domain-containing protein [Cokeromyces recurvatus]KAI7901504.1 Up-regulated during septation-domain-containing protein [Cokeromyces recurvatus]